MYKRKTTDIYEVQGLYEYYGYELLTTETTFKEARQRLREYRENEGGVYRIVKKREPKD